MNQHPAHPDIYQWRIVLRGISPLIWRRLLVRGDTTLAQLHLMIQILFDWSNDHLHCFHIFGKDYGSSEIMAPLPQVVKEGLFFPIFMLPNSPQAGGTRPRR